MTLDRGSVLNQRYRIVDILGQGGMAAVYRAIDENLGLEVALKENLFTTEEYARQFRREAVILANLRHPNLPRVTDHFVIEKQGQYLVMDYIEGEDLRQRMERQGPLSEGEAIILGVALCEALSYMHSRKPQVLHRDIKPGNVKITPHGQIYLVDFGLAKVMQGHQATTTGARAMTPGYSPPEQYGTARTDHRTDIYSVGATLYSALTDVIPEDGLARAMEQMTLTPLVKRNPKVSRRLAAVIEKAMAVRPDDRYQSADELRNELLNARSATNRRVPLELLLEPAPGDAARIAVDVGENKPPQILPNDSIVLHSVPVSSTQEDEAVVGKSFRRKRNRLGLWIPLLTLLLIAGLGAGVFLNPSGVNRFLEPYSLSLPTQMLAWAKRTPTATFSPQTGIKPSQTPAVVERTPTAQAPLNQTAVTPTASSIPTFTPTPTWTATPTIVPSPTRVGGGVGQIAFASNRTGEPQIWIMDVDGTNLRQITQIAEGACQPDWHPDGTRLVFISPCAKNTDVYWGASLFIIHVNGSGLTPLPTVPGGDYEPAWSPDGEMIAFTSVRNNDTPQIYLLSLADGQVTLLAEEPARPNSHPSWSPDGNFLAYMGADNQIRVMQRDGQGRFLAVRNVSEFKNYDPTWSPDSKVIVFSQTDTKYPPWLSAVQYSVDGDIPVKIPDSEYSIEPDYSPDGFWLVFTSYWDGWRDIYIMMPNGVNRQRLTNDLFTDFDPSWQPIQYQP
jgi:serine/threonine protein kinase